MKTNKKVHILLVLTTLVMLLTSCSNMISIEKRKYRKGFYIEHVAKSSSANNNSVAIVAEANAPEPSRELNQFKEDSLPKENVYAKEDFTEIKTGVPVKNKKQIIPTASTKKIVKAPLSFPVHSKKQTPVKNSRGDEEDEQYNGEGILIFFIVTVSFLLVLGLGLFGLLLLLWGGVTIALLMVVMGVLIIVGADILIIRHILRKSNDPETRRRRRRTAE